MHSEEVIEGQDGGSPDAGGGAGWTWSLPLDPLRWLSWAGLILLLVTTVQVLAADATALDELWTLGSVTVPFVFPGGAFPLQLLVGVALMVLARPAATGRGEILLRQGVLMTALLIAVAEVAGQLMGAADSTFPVFGPTSVSLGAEPASARAFYALMLLGDAIIAAVAAGVAVGAIVSFDRTAADRAHVFHPHRYAIAAVAVAGIAVYGASQAVAQAAVHRSPPSPTFTFPTSSSTSPRTLPSAPALPVAPLASVPPPDCSAAQFGPPLPPLDMPADPHHYAAPPPGEVDTSKLYEARILTARGAIVLCLDPSLAPNAVNTFVALARNHFYDDIPFYRVIPGLVVLTGDPTCIGRVPPPPAAPPSTCGDGGPGFSIAAEPVKASYSAGCVAMATSATGSNGSQFFICTADDRSRLTARYTIIGAVESGLQAALQIQQGDLMELVTVQQQL